MHARSNPLNPSNLIEQLGAIVGAGNVLTAANDTAPYLIDWRGRYRGAAACVVRPATTGEVSAIVRFCAQHGVPMVPQGGNTSHCGASIPDASGTAVLISLSRMNRIRAVDPVNSTITVEAGCVLQAVQQAARREEERLLPAQGPAALSNELAKISETGDAPDPGSQAALESSLQTLQAAAARERASLADLQNQLHQAPAAQVGGLLDRPQVAGQGARRPDEA